MTAPVSLSDAITRLWQPRLSLTGCVRGIMVRNTLGVQLAAHQRFNHYPATPLCSINWYFTGEVSMLEPGVPISLDAPRSNVPSRITLSGPHTRPTVSWNSGPAHGMMLLLLPDALQRLTGIEPRRYLNASCDAIEVLPQSWTAMCTAVAAAPDDNTRVQHIDSFLDPLWQAERPRQPLDAHRYADWVQGLALRAATSHTGRSLRQVERRIRLWAGLPLRELRGFGRAEQAFFQAMAAADMGHPTWSALAADTGYSDQPHLCRESRRITGCTPEELLRRIEQDEGFWPYRIWQ